ncbi:RNA polymerase sigma factor [Actinophytocola oryzae]|uniref:RNA polymerase sigma-70 factor (Sigma-E family) n=1 Tax=Actinophytocola oryzae TaxID=502181 RepID=A0A4R7VX26_9PSEU|nr:sigma-70 family RNA polymerase sigma factor [Actinophytocola oryzae]TDV54205.1 RNA polymerase sigma-70 factor (sigma-E family) [Actinophytocola oryzae]
MAIEVTHPPARTAPGLEAVLERQWMPLVRLATLLVGDADSAPDIVQDCYEAVWRLRPDLGDPEHFVAYLRKAVVNRSRSRLRRLRTVRRFLAQARPPADAPPADDPMLLAERHRELLEHIDRLPTRQREVIVLRYYCEMSEVDAAAAIGVSVGTVKSSAHRALATLRGKMKDDSDEH